MSHGMRVDLNGDVGESFGAYSLGHDPALVPHLTSVNIACGFHAGDPDVMRRTVALARRHSVAIGAHPSFPDLQGFGRRVMQLRADEVENLVLYQLGALAGVAAAEGAAVRHVKPHGALYNAAATDSMLADAIAGAVAKFDPSLILVGLSGSELIRAGRRAGLRTASEVFADRGYRADGALVPRGEPGAVFEDATAVAARAVAMVREGGVRTSDGQRVSLTAETVCIHGDTPGAPQIAEAVRAALETAGVRVMALSAAS
jgi:UPF0271 protein